MDIIAWYKKRGIGFIFTRAKRLKERYGFLPGKSIQQIESCLHALQGYNCLPTFAVPGIVVERNGSFFRRLQQAGAEIAVHGYNHVDLKTYPPQEGSRQLMSAAKIFRTNGLEVHGFRCPYLSATDELIRVLPPGLFGYSSNKAVEWPICDSSEPTDPLLYETIKSFYLPVKAKTNLCLPWFQDGLVEIPASVPDDLQLHDGLGWGLERISELWVDILHKTHQRGELFNLMFHPELASFCEAPFMTTLREARALQPGVWVARLKEISAWWFEKANFRVETICEDNHFSLKFHCTPRATIVGRGFDPKAKTSHWADDYWRLEAEQLTLDGPTLPFIGLPVDTPAWILSALQRMGYIVEQGEMARLCSLYIDETRLSSFKNPVELVTYIESSEAPIMRYWPWPDGMRSALSITGDLDALSLIDYAFRLVKK